MLDCFCSFLVSVYSLIFCNRHSSFPNFDDLRSFMNLLKGPWCLNYLFDLSLEICINPNPILMVLLLHQGVSPISLSSFSKLRNYHKLNNLSKRFLLFELKLIDCLTSFHWLLFLFFKSLFRFFDQGWRHHFRCTLESLVRNQVFLWWPFLK